MKMNQFTDMNKKEFTDRYLTRGLKINKRNAAAVTEELKHPMLEHSRSHLPEKVDWKELGKVSLPGDQGECGSCWAWTSAALLESLNSIENDLDVTPVYSV